MNYSFFVDGHPKPQARPRLARGFIYSKKSDWRKLVTMYAIKHGLKIGQIEGPLSINLCFFFERPKSHFRAGKFSKVLKDNASSYCTNRYDIDNLEKAVLDALTDSKLIKDDHFIVALNTRKYWTSQAYNQVGVDINIKRLDDDG